MGISAYRRDRRWPRRRPTHRTARCSSLALRGTLRLLDMAAELEAQRREQLVGELLLAARAEAGEEGRADHRRGDALVDRRLQCPAPLAGIGDPAVEVGQVGILAQCAGGEVEQPRADD